MITAAVDRQPLGGGGAPPAPQAGAKQATPLRGFHTCCLTGTGPSYSSPLFCPPPQQGGASESGQECTWGSHHTELQTLPLQRG